MAILNLEAMARYGAYSIHLDKAIQPPRGNKKFSGIEFFGGTASIKKPIVPVDYQKALQLEAFFNDVDRGGKTEIKIFNPENNQTFFDLGNITLRFDKKPTGSLVSIVPDPSKKFKVQTDLAAGATVFNSIESMGTSTFTFQPGAKQEVSYLTSTGVDIAYSVTEGISKTTSAGGSNTTTVGVEIGGSFAGIDASTNLEQSWTREWSNSQTVDFSSTNTKTVSKTQQLSTTVDLGSIQPNAQGKYFYGNLELIPGKKYVISVTEEVSTLKTPITGTFVITPTIADGADIQSSYAVRALVFDEEFVNRSNVDSAISIYEAYKTYNYDALVKQNLAGREWILEQNPSRLFMSLTNWAIFSGSTNLNIEVKPFAQSQSRIGANVSPFIASSVNTLPATQRKAQSQYTKELNTQNIFLDDFNTSNGIPGVAFDLADFSGELNQSYVINGTTEGGDYVILNSNQSTLQNFKDSTFEVNGGFNKFDDAPGNGFNTYFLNEGNNTIYLRSGSNFIDSAGGFSLINVDASTKLDVDSDLGTEILKISDAGSEVLFYDWDFESDKLIFGGSIGLKDVRVEYDSGLGSYQVSVDDRPVAVLDAKDDSLPIIDSVTGMYQGTSVQPFAFAAAEAGVFIRTLYAAALNRLPCVDELKRYESDIKSGETRASVVESVLTSREFVAELPTDREYVAAVYRTLLGKDPSPSQLRKSARRLDDGMQRSSFVESVLGKERFANFFGQELSMIGVQETGLF